MPVLIRVYQYITSIVLMHLNFEGENPQSSGVKTSCMMIQMLMGMGVNLVLLLVAVRMGMDEIVGL